MGAHKAFGLFGAAIACQLAATQAAQQAEVGQRVFQHTGTLQTKGWQTEQAHLTSTSGAAGGAAQRGGGGQAILYSQARKASRCSRGLASYWLTKHRLEATSTSTQGAQEPPFPPGALALTVDSTLPACVGIAEVLAADGSPDSLGG